MSRRPSTLPRRSLAGATAALVLAGTVPAKAVSLDGELLRLVGEFVAHVAAERASLSAMTQEEQGMFHHKRFVDWYKHGIRSPTETMVRVIARIPAKGQDGIQAKARALLWYHGGSDAGPLIAIGDGLWESLLADMTGTPCRFHLRSRQPDAEGSA